MKGIDSGGDTCGGFCYQGQCVIIPAGFRRSDQQQGGSIQIRKMNPGSISQKILGGLAFIQQHQHGGATDQAVLRGIEVNIGGKVARNKRIGKVA